MDDGTAASEGRRMEGGTAADGSPSLASGSWSPCLLTPSSALRPLSSLLRPLLSVFRPPPSVLRPASSPSGSVGVIRRSSGSRMWIRSSKSPGRFA